MIEANIIAGIKQATKEATSAKVDDVTAFAARFTQLEALQGLKRMIFRQEKASDVPLYYDVPDDCHAQLLEQMLNNPDSFKGIPIGHIIPDDDVCYSPEAQILFETQYTQGNKSYTSPDESIGLFDFSQQLELLQTAVQQGGEVAIEALRTISAINRLIKEATIHPQVRNIVSMSIDPPYIAEARHELSRPHTVETGRLNPSTFSLFIPPGEIKEAEVIAVPKRTIVALETQYNGYTFRSREEARWAVFFDTLGIAYSYETEGYKLKSNNYLPDFFIKNMGIIEVKGPEPTEIDRQKASELSLLLGQNVYIFYDSFGNNIQNESALLFQDGKQAGTNYSWYACSNCNAIGIIGPDSNHHEACNCGNCNPQDQYIEGSLINRAMEAAKKKRFEKQ